MCEVSANGCPKRSETTFGVETELDAALCPSGKKGDNGNYRYGLGLFGYFGWHGALVATKRRCHRQPPAET